MEFLLGAGVLMVGVIIGAAISRMNADKPDNKNGEEAGPYG